MISLSRVSPVILSNHKHTIFSAFLGLLSLALPAQEICNDGIDNDGDGKTDCYDPECSGKSVCDGFYYGNPIPHCQKQLPVNTYSLVPVWVTSFNVDTRNTVTTGDIDGDCVPEVFVKSLLGEGNLNDTLKVIDGATGTLKFNIPTFPSFSADCQAIGDIDNDGFGEIIIMRSDAMLMCYEHTGMLKWTSSQAVGYVLGGGKVEGPIWVPNIADFDGDGTPEIYLGNQIFNAQNGNFIVQAPAGVAGSIGNNYGAGNSRDLANPVAADVLPSGFCADCAGLELICGNEVYSVNIAAATMSLVSTAPAALTDGLCAVADFNGDGLPDVIVNSYVSGSGPAEVYVWDPRTQAQIGTSFPLNSASALTGSAGQGGRPVVADFDGDGLPDIGVGVFDGFVVIDNTMTELWSKKIDDTSGKTGATVFDLEGDGNSEVIFRSEEFLFIWNGQNGNVITTSICGSGTGTETPVIVDVDNDGEANIVCTCMPFRGGFNGLGLGSITAWKSNVNRWLPTRKVWHQQGYQPTFVNDDLSIPRFQQNPITLANVNDFLVQSPLRDINGNLIYVLLPDATIRIDSINQGACGDSVDVYMTICNIGSTPFMGNIPVTLYNGDPLTGGTLMQNTVIPPDSLQLCDELKIADTCRIYTAKVPSGNYDLFVYVNDLGTNPLNAPSLLYEECDSTNNFDSITIAFSSSFTVTISTSTVSCNGGANGVATATASGSSGYTYSWSPAVSSAASVSGLSAGTYTLLVTDASGCTRTSTVTVTEPVALTATLTSSPSDCNASDGTASASASGGTAPYLYNWSNGQTAQNISGLSSNTYSVTITDLNGCVQTQTVLVASSNGPNIVTSQTNILCNGQCTGTAAASVAGGAQPYTYSWTNGQNSSAVTNLCAGDYTVTITDAIGCTAMQAVTITESAPPAITLSATSVLLNAGSSATLTATGGVTYQWSPLTGLSCSTCSNPVATPSETTTYCVLVTDGNGCTDSACIVIYTDIPCKTLYIPNAFSPNNDSENDEECVFGSCVEEFHLVIYGRWGEKVFESTDQKICWDGTHRGKPLNSGVFTFYLNVTFTDGSKFSEKGNISLVR